MEYIDKKIQLVSKLTSPELIDEMMLLFCLCVCVYVEYTVYAVCVYSRGGLYIENHGIINTGPGFLIGQHCVPVVVKCTKNSSHSRYFCYMAILSGTISFSRVMPLDNV